jgi:putative phosphoribosyl transferase
MTFASREAAGQQLGNHLRAEGVVVDVVAGLPRGGVIVAAEVAHILRVALDVLVVRKIGHPWHREFAVGALAEHNVLVLDEQAIGPNPAVRSALDEIIEEETRRLQQYQAQFRAQPGDLAGKSVLLVDDGLATGATTEAAVLSANRQKAREVLVAAPVASTNAVERLQRVADEVFAIVVDPAFEAVGRYYDEFTQTTDEEVMELLRAEHARKP